MSLVTRGSQADIVGLRVMIIIVVLCLSSSVVLFKKPHFRILKRCPHIKSAMTELCFSLNFSHLLLKQGVRCLIQ